MASDGAELATELERDGVEGLSGRFLSWGRILATMLDGVLIVSADGRVVIANEAAARIFGVPVKELLRPLASYAERFHLRTPDGEQPALIGLRALGGEIVAPVDRLIRTPEGNDKAVRGSAAPLRDDKGGVVGAVMVLGDVTAARAEEVRAREHAAALREREEKLRASEARARAIVDHVMDQLVVLRAERAEGGGVADWRYVDANDAASALLGTTREALLGRTVREVLPGRSEAIEARLARVLETGLTERYESGFGDRAFLVSLFRVDADTVGSAALEVTESKRAEEALRAQLELKDQLAKIAESVPGVICSYQLRPDGTACFPFATAAAHDVWGVAPEVAALDAGAVFANIHPEDAARVQQVIGEAAARLSRWHDTFRYRHPTKGLRWLEGWSVPKVEPDGSIVWHGYVMDVTEHRLAEDALRSADQRKNEFLGVLSHELRNPLAPIRNSIHVLDRAPADSPQAARAREVARRQTEHLARLVDDLLDVTRISRGKIQLQREVVDLRDVVRRTCEDHRSLFEQSEVELHIDLPPGPVAVDADPARLAQVVGNLLQNSSKFTPAGGHVVVAVRERDGQARITVKDDGIGMDPGQVERMFEPFSQEERGLARTRGGLGLGLALAKGLVALHGGTVTARSEGAGRGAEFAVALPLVAPAPLAGPSPLAPAAAAAGKLVLVIEDNLDAAQSLADVLTLEGHRVRVARDGTSGIALARELRPDFVLCDIGLPDVDGYEVARTIRGDDALRATRLVAVSGYAQPEDRLRAREAGFDLHLAKPSGIDELAKLLA